ncbi:MAG: 50S ribosomal protein L21 [Bacteroidia bacterium]
MMYAIISIGGQQFKVEKDQKLFVNRLEGQEGDTVELGNVMLMADGDNFSIGSPSIDKAKVKVKILKQEKGDKVIIFKKKRRKGYKVKRGHRQHLSQVQVQEILK